MPFIISNLIRRDIINKTNCYKTEYPIIQLLSSSYPTPTRELLRLFILTTHKVTRMKGNVITKGIGLVLDYNYLLMR